MSTSIDLSRTTGLVTLGTHTFQVTDRSSEEMGNQDPYWRLICKVISSGDDQGKEIMHQISLGHTSRFKMDEFLDGIGAPKRGKWTLEQSVGKKFRASVAQDVYGGKTRSVLETIIPAEALQMSLDEPSETAPASDASLPTDVLEEAQAGADEPQPGRRRF